MEWSNSCNIHIDNWCVFFQDREVIWADHNSFIHDDWENISDNLHEYRIYTGGKIEDLYITKVKDHNEVHCDLVIKNDMYVYIRQNYIFHSNDSSDFLEYFSILPGADPNTIEHISSKSGHTYIKDGNSVYFLKQAQSTPYGYWRIIDVYTVLKWADSETFREIGGWYWKDKDNVFYQWKLLPGADSTTFWCEDDMSDLYSDKHWKYQFWSMI